MSNKVWLGARISSTSDSVAIISVNTLSASAWGIHSRSVAKPCESPCFIECEPVLNFAAKRVEAKVCVVVEEIDYCLVTEPSSCWSFVLKRRGQVPVEKSDPRSDTSCNQRIKHVVVEVDALLIGLVYGAIRQDSRP